jgi:hypothetical protein
LILGESNSSVEKPLVDYRTRLTGTQSTIKIGKGKLSDKKQTTLSFLRPSNSKVAKYSRSVDGVIILNSTFSPIPPSKSNSSDKKAPQTKLLETHNNQLNSTFSHILPSKSTSSEKKASTKLLETHNNQLNSTFSHILPSKSTSSENKSSTKILETHNNQLNSTFSHILPSKSTSSEKKSSNKILETHNNQFMKGNKGESTSRRSSNSPSNIPKTNILNTFKKPKCQSASSDNGISIQNKQLKNDVVVNSKFSTPKSSSSKTSKRGSSQKILRSLPSDDFYVSDGNIFSTTPKKRKHNDNVDINLEMVDDDSIFFDQISPAAKKPRLSNAFINSRSSPQKDDRPDSASTVDSSNSSVKMTIDLPIIPLTNMEKNDSMVSKDQISEKRAISIKLGESEDDLLHIETDRVTLSTTVVYNPDVSDTISSDSDDGDDIFSNMPSKPISNGSFKVSNIAKELPKSNPNPKFRLDLLSLSKSVNSITQSKRKIESFEAVQKLEIKEDNVEVIVTNPISEDLLDFCEESSCNDIDEVISYESMICQSIVSRDFPESQSSPFYRFSTNFKNLIVSKQLSTICRFGVFPSRQFIRWLINQSIISIT